MSFPRLLTTQPQLYPRKMTPASSLYRMDDECSDDDDDDGVELTASEKMQKALKTLLACKAIGIPIEVSQSVNYWSGYRLLLSRECLSHVTTYFRLSARTFESILCRGSNIRVNVIGGTRTTHHSISIHLFSRIVQIETEDRDK